ncbi:hypothetical protein C9374_009727 [Naegleria lovaniensis]|uniref:Derlin n=1 Tax=Naegleria lovaniensis TaxID=51637 RepID=A0AA88H1Q4_NAELO|nr:uncharacterized protein C9374_009727 [Naegleria lovaniensis]KAG2393150.1 hypothetical protein C9374_009727 [Naegleria lovaniensis]
MTSFWDLWAGWPFVTKHIGVFAFAMTCAVSFKFISPYYFVLLFDRIFSTDIEFWRLITSAFFFGGFGMNFLFAFLIFIQYSAQLEKDRFDGRVADYIFCIIVGILAMSVFAYFTSAMLLSSSLMMYLVYIWCNFHPDSNLRLMFVPVEVPSRYFPFALAALHIVLGGGMETLIEDGIGILCGHIYYFLDEKYPQEYGSRLLTTPSLLYWIFPPNTMPQVHGVHNNAQRQPPPQERGGFQGRGRVLGHN